MDEFKSIFMGILPYLILSLLMIAFILYKLLPKFFPSLQEHTPDTRAPHERWPEILHWQAGDEFNQVYSTKHTKYNLIEIREDGYAAVHFLDEKDWVHVSHLVGHNASLKTRQVDDGLKNSSHEYMELIREFQKSYKELQERDKRNELKRTA